MSRDLDFEKLLDDIFQCPDQKSKEQSYDLDIEKLLHSVSDDISAPEAPVDESKEEPVATSSTEDEEDVIAAACAAAAQYLIEQQNKTPEKYDASEEGKTREGQPCTSVHVVKHVLENMELYSEDEISNVRNGMYDEALKSHFFSRIALYVQKTLQVVKEESGVPMSKLMHMASSMEMYKCQAVMCDNKNKCVRQCDTTSVAGFFFCGAHRKDYSYKEGVHLHKKRRMGEHPEDDQSGKWVSKPGCKRVHTM